MAPQHSNLTLCQPTGQQNNYTGLFSIYERNEIKTNKGPQNSCSTQSDNNCHAAIMITKKRKQKIFRSKITNTEPETQQKKYGNHHRKIQTEDRLILPESESPVKCRTAGGNWPSVL